LLHKLTILSEIAVELLFVFCLKMKSGPFKRIFPTEAWRIAIRTRKKDRRRRGFSYGSARRACRRSLEACERL